MDFRSERLIRIPSSGRMARSSGEYQPIRPGFAGIGKAPHSYAASASSSSKTRDTPMRSSCRHISGDPNGEPISAYSHRNQTPVQGWAGVVPESGDHRLQTTATYAGGRTLPLEAVDRTGSPDPEQSGWRPEGVSAGRAPEDRDGHHPSGQYRGGPRSRRRAAPGHRDRYRRLRPDA